MKKLIEINEPTLEFLKIVAIKKGYRSVKNYIESKLEDEYLESKNKNSIL